MNPEESPLRHHLRTQAHNLQELIASDVLHSSVEQAIVVLSGAIRSGKPILTCGNGGSASDALHIAGELVGEFHISRPAINVVCLNANVSVLTAWSNDVSYNSAFARQVEAHGDAGGVLWGLSTSGNSQNVIEACEAARVLGMQTIAMTGRDGGALARIASNPIRVPADDAPSAQNLHVVLYHYICAEVERLSLSD